jgi:hypothetical protein
MYTKFSTEHTMGRDHICDIDRRIILKRISNNQGVRAVPNGKVSEHGNKLVCLNSTQGGEFPDKLIDCMISGFHHKTDANCALLRCFTVSSGNSLPT